jgi:hypothetical protein
MIRGTREWAVAEINCCTGCPHGCRYCYARAAALEKGIIASPQQWANSVINPDQVEREHPLYPGQVMFPAAHDIIPENIEAAVTVVAHLLELGNRVLIVSKPSPHCIGRLCDEFSKCREQILFRFTITARNQRIVSFWEPGAPSYQQRLQALKLAHERGFATSVSIEPMLDTGDVAAMVTELGPWVSHSIWLGKMNRIAGRVVIDSPGVAEEVARVEREQSDEQIRKIYSLLQDNQLIRWKESIKNIVGLPLTSQPGLDI